ncbi:CHAT domain-containing protein [Saccharopolyspora taberi]|uniref:CHAT domain-containing protein n=1 Tax=Saccharopolyspora taberi TaxID=60895 RepID=A0ABN3VKF9_9PSEU
MTDDAGRQSDRFRGLQRWAGGQGRADTGSGWFSDAEAGGDQPEAPRAHSQQPEQQRAPEQRNPEQRTSEQRNPEQRTPEQRYADAIAAMNRIVTTLDFEPLPWVTEVFRATAGALHEKDPARAGVLNNLGSASQLTHLRSGDPADLDDAVSYYRAAASTARSDDTDLVLYRCNLALALTDRATKTGNAEDATESAAIARQAVDETPQKDQRRVMALIRLGNALKLHARLADDPASDNESINVFRAAVRGSSGGEAASELMVSLGGALLRRYERAGAVEDLDEGISHLSSGAGSMPDSEPRRAALCHLASALRLRFRHNGDLADLHSAISELIGVLGVLEPGHPLLGKAVWNLAVTVVEHVDSTGEPSQLRRVLRPITPAVRGMSRDDADRAVALAGYGALLRRHFLHGAEAAVIDAAVRAAEAAAEAAGSGARCPVLNSLGTTLVTRYEHNSAPADLTRAEEVAREAIDLASRENRPQHPALSLLGLVTMHRFRQTSKTVDLEAAIDLFDQALNAMPEDAPARAAVAAHLGRAVQTLHQRSGRRKLYRWARRILTEAAAQATAPADQRLRAAILCGRLAAQAQRWAEAQESFGTAVELLPLVTRGKRVVASPAVQQRWALVAADAAACALENGEPERAVELLEHGRSAILADFLPTGGELGELHRSHPDLADEAVRLRRLLDRGEEEPALAESSDGDRQRLTTAWAALVDEIRAVPGHRNHLRPTPFQELAPAGADGAVVLVNLSRYRSDALVVFGGRVLTVPLTKAAPEFAAMQAENALTAVQDQTSQPLAEVLDWLWHNLTRPVLDRMGYLGTPGAGQRWPRIWWAAVGAAAFLPLHAAASLSGDCALERVVSSYTPTLSCLLRAKQRPHPENGIPLVAAGSQERVARELPQQNQILAQHWPRAEIRSMESTTPNEMLRLIPEHPWLHVCENSTQYPAQPAAALVLDREPPHRSLGVVELGQLTLDEAEFCYLGQTATAADTPSAAAVNLAESLGFAGYNHVVGTLWEVDEDVATEVHAEVYETVFGAEDGGTDHSAYALHEAARRLRHQAPDNPERWSAHVHVGP